MFPNMKFLLKKCILNKIKRHEGEKIQEYKNVSYVKSLIF